MTWLQELGVHWLKEWKSLDIGKKGSNEAYDTTGVHHGGQEQGSAGILVRWMTWLREVGVHWLRDVEVPWHWEEGVQCSLQHHWSTSLGPGTGVCRYFSLMNDLTEGSGGPLTLGRRGPVQPTTPQEDILKGVVKAALFQDQDLWVFYFAEWLDWGKWGLLTWGRRGPV